MNLTDLHAALQARGAAPDAPVELAGAVATISPADAIAQAFHVLAPDAPALPAGAAPDDLELLREICAALAAFHFHGLGAVAAQLSAALPAPAPPPIPPPFRPGGPQES